MKEMTPAAARRVQLSYERLGDCGDALATAFYKDLFSRAPGLRRVFPDDMTSLQGHFHAALAPSTSTGAPALKTTWSPGSRS